MSARSDAQRIGIFGGTFDPPHVGHLLTARDAAERLRLDRVLWIPAGQQPFKAAGDGTPAADRRRMVELTVAGESGHEVESMEVERGGLSYTVETLRALRDRHPGAELYLLLGEDAWRTFGSWREPATIQELATVAVLVRGSEAQSPGGGIPGSGAATQPVMLPTRRVDVSATEIRNRVRSGLSIRGLVVEPVERYIAEHRLYH